MPTKKEQIISKAVEIIKSAPEGIRYYDLARAVNKELPEIKKDTIFTYIWNLDAQIPEKVYKAARGLFRHVMYRGQSTEQVEQPIKSGVQLPKEDVFYQPFAEWLVGEDECTKAISLGGNKFGGRWGTPDVLGVYKPRPGDIVEAPVEIISAEIKTNKSDLITAFGQACSYKLFSHKSYLVIPKGSSEEDISRIDALCLIFGLGLILFDVSNAEDPQFEIRTRPTKHEPDMFYVNEYLKKDPKVVAKLFS